jgi:hypothetical protein
MTFRRFHRSGTIGCGYPKAAKERGYQIEGNVLAPRRKYFCAISRDFLDFIQPRGEADWNPQGWTNEKWIPRRRITEGQDGVRATQISVSECPRFSPLIEGLQGSSD